jgi:hypothetical protein
MGGNESPPTNTAEVIDLTQSSPTWRAVGSMVVARRKLNATLLPDGTVLVTGGTRGSGFNNLAGAVHTAELWNPTTEKWTTLASSKGIPRIYHSIALLLPVARVLSMGGNDQMTSEIYSPPYLFNGARPTITSAPQIRRLRTDLLRPNAKRHSNFKGHDARLSSVTLVFNMSQYIIEFQKGPSGPLTFSPTPGGGGLNVVAPSAAAVAFPATLAPPGTLPALHPQGFPTAAGSAQRPSIVGRKNRPNRKIEVDSGDAS